MTAESDPLVWSVDRSWGNVKADQEGNMFPSDARKYHVDRGDTTAKCSGGILLNSLTHPIQGHDSPAGWASEVHRDSLCRRCVPIQPEAKR